MITGFQRRGQTYQIDLLHMCQTNLSTQVTRAVRKGGDGTGPFGQSGAAAETEGARAFTDNDCAQCHKRAADAEYWPCGHRFLCWGCAVTFNRACNNGDGVCSSCGMAGGIKRVSPIPKHAMVACAVCCELWPQGRLYSAPKCGHILCIGDLSPHSANKENKYLKKKKRFVSFDWWDGGRGHMPDLNDLYLAM